ncbi:MAG: NADPH-dependent reductase [Eubacterium sp.]|jgi:NAD(P)H-dependent FMN reductase|nr:NADPH-dependent reductase [Eubacterium sp.]
MRILMINGSPHKGNTWRAMCAAREEILKEDPYVIFEEIHLSSLKLPFCTGCSLCFRKGRDYCPHSSIMKEVFDKMEAADGLIFGASTFYMAPNALAKNLIDHWSFFTHRPHFFKNKALVVSTTAGVFANKTVDFIAGALQSIGYNKCFKLPITAYSWNVYDPDEKARQKIKKVSLKFYKDVASGKLHEPGIGLMIPYNLFRGMGLNYVKGSEYETEDGVYWTDPKRVKATYDPSIKVSFYKKPFGMLFYLVGKWSARFITITYRK